MAKTSPSNRPTGRSRGRPALSLNDKGYWFATWGAAAEAICALVAEGSSLRAACAKYQDITPAAFLGWTQQHKEFAKVWGRALVTRANAKFEDIDELADEIKALAANPKIDAKSKLMCLAKAADIKQWVAAKLDPQTYGDRAGSGPGVAIQINTTLPIAGVDPLDDGSGTFTVKVAPGPAVLAHENEEQDASVVKPGGDPLSTAEFRP